MTPAFLVENQMGKWWYLILPIIICLVSCGDLCVTLYFDKTCSDFHEANPIALHIWTTCGDYGLIGFKLALTFVSCLCMGLVLSQQKSIFADYCCNIGTCRMCLYRWLVVFLGFFWNNLVSCSYNKITAPCRSHWLRSI